MLSEVKMMLRDALKGRPDCPDCVFWARIFVLAALVAGGSTGLLIWGFIHG